MIRDAGIDVSVFGITGVSSTVDRQAFLDAGVDKVLIKPVSRSDIKALIDKLR